jgi:hypothetical protein
VAQDLQVNIHFSMERGMRIFNWVQVFFVYKKNIISAVTRVEFVTDNTLYIILRGQWCHIIVLNVHAPTEDKTDGAKGSYYKKLKHVINKFPKYQPYIPK